MNRGDALIYTTYFAKLKYLPSNVTPIAICGKTPDFYQGLCYKKLAPKWSFFTKWKETRDNNYYISEFNRLVLEPLDVNTVVNDLVSMSTTEHIALVCYEKPQDFCHRHLIAKWLNENGYDCDEFNFNTLKAST